MAEFILLATFVFGGLGFWEYLTVRDLSQNAGLVGVRVLGLSGTLPEGHAGTLSTENVPRGFFLRSLGPGAFLIRTAVDWWEPKVKGGPALPSIATLTIDGRRWVLTARSSVGIAAVFAAAGSFFVAEVWPSDLTILGRLGLVAWIGGVLAAFVLQWRSVRRTFTQLAVHLFG